MEQEVALLKWINSLDSEIQTQEITQLYDGVSFFQLMNKLYPKHFSTEDIEMAPESWIHRFQNLQQFNSQMQIYYQQVLNQEYQKNRVELIKVAKNKDKKSILILIELILGAIIQGPDKEFFIDRMMALDEATQGHLMPLIQKILDKNFTEEIITPLKQSQNVRQNTTQQNIIEIKQNEDIQHQKNQSIARETTQLMAQIESLETRNEQLQNHQQEMRINEKVMTNKIDDLIRLIDEKQNEINISLQKKLSLYKKLSVQSDEDLEQQFIANEKNIKDLQNQLEFTKKDMRQKLEEITSELDEKKKKINQLQKSQKNQEVLEQKLLNYEHMIENHKQIKAEEQSIIKSKNQLQEKIETLNFTIQQYQETIDQEKKKSIEMELIITKLYQENQTFREENIFQKSQISQLEQQLNDQEFSLMEIPDQRTSNIIQQDLEQALMNIQYQYEKSQTSQINSNEQIKNDLLKRELDILRSNMGDLVKENENIKIQLMKIQKQTVIKDQLANEKLAKKEDQIKLILQLIQEKFKFNK